MIRQGVSLQLFTTSAFGVSQMFTITTTVIMSTSRSSCLLFKNVLLKMLKLEVKDSSNSFLTKKSLIPNAKKNL